MFIRTIVGDQGIRQDLTSSRPSFSFDPSNTIILPTDASFYVSGSSTEKSVFGGNVVVSGSFTSLNGADFAGDVIEVSGSLYVTGSSYFSSSVVIYGGITGSLTQLSDASTSYIVGGPGISISTSSIGQISISSSLGPSGSWWSTGVTGSNNNLLTADGSGGIVTETNFNFDGSVGYLTLTGSFAHGSGSTSASPYSHAEGQQTIAGLTYFAASITNGTASISGDWQAYFNIGDNFMAVTDSSGNLSVDGYPNTATIDGISYDGSTTYVTSSRTDYTNFVGVFDMLPSYAELILPPYAGPTDPVIKYVSNSHTEGNGSWALCNSSHAEGFATWAFGDYSHAEGLYSTAAGIYSHAEGEDARALGNNSHAEGFRTTSSGTYSHAEGTDTISIGLSSHAEGNGSTSSGSFSHAEGSESLASGIGSHAEGYKTTAAGDYSHSEGYQSTAFGIRSHAEGEKTVSLGSVSHAEGYQTVASGTYSHAEGAFTTARGVGSHAQGTGTWAIGAYSHAEGNDTYANGDFSRAEGYQTKADGIASKAIGNNTWAIGDSSYASGFQTIASGTYSHTEGYYTIASGSNQFVIGQYNKRGNDTSLFVVGNGTGDSDANRSDILRVETNGLQVTGSIFPGADSTYTLGAADNRWAHVYTGDLHLRNERGDWTIVEEREYLCVVNNITGKRYKMALLPIEDET